MTRADELRAQIAEMTRRKDVATKLLASLKVKIAAYNNTLKNNPGDNAAREAKIDAAMEQNTLQEDVEDFTSGIAAMSRNLNIALGQESKNPPLDTSSGNGPNAGRAKAELDETNKIWQRLKNNEREVLSDITRLKGNDPDGSKNAAYAALDKIRRDLANLSARQSFLKNKLQKQS